ncbi:TetR/AcrR family transcriptional regulator [Actinoplanes utahensis]|uniref:TetR/AcrR family transcriptional regulator n=1 Tax=Actinoplanes utahensis TaxID=1869 RepID=UPI00068C3EBB|nr:TetR/AcrR family transcriptional regulator [Actinoplanes utahensis]GIF32843.1 TetR family transcriptional regulator [Actinoplanes utahensis]
MGDDGTNRTGEGDSATLTVVVPHAGRPVRERADAARNRERVLDAARRLYRERDPRTVTMEDIAAAAGVGRATLYRRYRDPAAVAVALLDEHDRSLQEQLISGPPPLGPGAAPADRLAAFYAAMLDLLDEHLPLALSGETGAARFRTGAYEFWRLHVRVLLRAAGVPDPEPLVDILLAPLAPELYQHQRRHGLDRRQIAAALDRLARALLPEPGRRDAQ